jgi:hypothetical protein
MSFTSRPKGTQGEQRRHGRIGERWSSIGGRSRARAGEGGQGAPPEAAGGQEEKIVHEHGSGVGLYTVENGKIVREEFFYTTG